MGKDVQRSLLWVILCAALFMLWDNYQVYKGNDSFFAPATTEQTDNKSIQKDVPLKKANIDETIDLKKNVEPLKPVVVTTDLLKVTFDLNGAAMTRSELIKMPLQADWTEVGLAGAILGKEAKEDLGNVVLFDQNSQRTYVAQSGLIGGVFPNHKDTFKLVSKTLNLGDSNTLDVVFESVKNDIKVQKIYTFTKGHYDVKVETKVKNLSKQAVQPSIYYQLTRDANKPEGDNSFYSTFTGFAVYSDEENFQKIDFDEIADSSASYQKQTNNGWIGMVQHYFVSAWLPTQNQDRENFVRSLDNGLYSAGTVLPLGELAPGASVKDSAVLYTGPQNQKVLAELAPGFELVVDYGWLTFLAKPIYWLLEYIQGLLGNWGWAIVLLTCLVKLVLYPISAASYKSMARMKAVTPRMKALQEKFKDDKPRLNQAMMDLYRTEKINPIGGCLPVVAQIPVFLSLYWVLLGSVELRGSEWMFWLTDLSTPDPWFILPLIMSVTMFLQIMLNPKPTDPTQAKVMYMMPLVFSVMFFIFASGLVLYWLTNNILSIAQQWWINKQINEEAQKKKQ